MHPRMVCLGGEHPGNGAGADHVHGHRRGFGDDLSLCSGGVPGYGKRLVERGDGHGRGYNHASAPIYNARRTNRAEGDGGHGLFGQPELERAGERRSWRH